MFDLETLGKGNDHQRESEVGARLLFAVVDENLNCHRYRQYFEAHSHDRALDVLEKQHGPTPRDQQETETSSVAV